MVGSASGPGSTFKAFLGSAQVRVPLSNKIRVRVGSVQHIHRSLQVQIFGHVKTSTSKGTSDAHIPQVGMILKFRVFLKWCQWSCKTTPFLPCQKQLILQLLISVHISLHANDHCLPRPSLLWKRKGDSQIIIKNIKCETHYFWRCSWIMKNGY